MIYVEHKPYTYCDGDDKVDHRSSHGAGIISRPGKLKATCIDDRGLSRQCEAHGNLDQRYVSTMPKRRLRSHANELFHTKRQMRHLRVQQNLIQPLASLGALVFKLLVCLSDALLLTSI